MEPKKMYAIAIKEEEDSYIDGPTPDLESLLHRPAERGSVIVELTMDKPVVRYKCFAEGVWLKKKPSLWENMELCEQGEETYGDIERKAFIEEQESNGMVILFPKEDELFIDCDTEEHFRIFIENFDMLNRNLLKLKPLNLGVEKRSCIEMWESKGGAPGVHIIVQLPFNVDSTKRIAFQAALGSDPKRELLSLVRMENGDEFPTIFVEKPGFKRRK